MSVLLLKLHSTPDSAARHTHHAPTDAQKESGNYRKGRFRWNGLEIAIENPRGSIRSGNGWQVRMGCHYGYFVRTNGQDGDPVDVFIGPDLTSDRVFVLNQVNAAGRFDEHKVIIGCRNAGEARQSYLSCYEQGWKTGKIIQIDTTELKRRLAAGEFANGKMHKAHDVSSEPRIPAGQHEGGQWTGYQKRLNRVDQLVYRGMSSAEYHAWVKKGEIPAGRHCASGRMADWAAEHAGFGKNDILVSWLAPAGSVRRGDAGDGHWITHHPITIGPDQIAIVAGNPKTIEELQGEKEARNDARREIARILQPGVILRGHANSEIEIVAKQGRSYLVREHRIPELSGAVRQAQRKLGDAEEHLDERIQTRNYLVRHPDHVDLFDGAVSDDDIAAAVGAVDKAQHEYADQLSNAKAFEPLQATLSINELAAHFQHDAEATHHRWGNDETDDYAEQVPFYAVWEGMNKAYDPEESRVPAGSEHGGEWMKEAPSGEYIAETAMEQGHAHPDRDQFIRASAFKRWFGDWEARQGSQVVDHLGRPQEQYAPRPVYHGTASFQESFRSFDPARTSEGSLFGPGLYFTEDPEYAALFTNGPSEPEGSWDWLKWGRESKPVYELITPITPSMMGRMKRWLNSQAGLNYAYEDVGMRESYNALVRAIQAGPEAVAELFLSENAPQQRVFIDRFGLKKRRIGRDAILEFWLNIRKPFDTKDIDAARTIVKKRGGDIAAAEKEAKQYGTWNQMYGGGLQGVDYLAAGLSLTMNGRHNPELRRILEEEGYDGIVDRGGHGASYGKPVTVWVAFHPNQVKSTANDGSFDPESVDFFKTYDPSEPRVPSGDSSGGQWTKLKPGDPHPHGHAPTTAEQLTRAKSMDITPMPTLASWGLWLSSDPGAAVQATWFDARGRKQYGYNSAAVAQRDQKKFTRLKHFTGVLPKMRQQIDHDLKTLPAGDRNAVAATVARIIERTAMRVGSEEYAGENETFGASSLRKEHVAIAGDRITFRFVGKHHKEHDITVTDDILANRLRELMGMPGERLMQFRRRKNVAPLTEVILNDYLKQWGVTAKDFRTFHATQIVWQALRDAGTPADMKEAKRTVVRAIKEAAAFLGNTPAMCRNSYVNPAVINDYLSKAPSE